MIKIHFVFIFTPKTYSYVYRLQAQLVYIYIKHDFMYLLWILYYKYSNVLLINNKIKNNIISWKSIQTN